MYTIGDVKVKKVKSVLLSVIWIVVILIFPVVSGVIVTVLEMNQIQIFITQGCFMIISLAIPIL